MRVYWYTCLLPDPPLLHSPLGFTIIGRAVKSGKALFIMFKWTLKCVCVCVCGGGGGGADIQIVLTRKCVKSGPAIERSDRWTCMVWLSF